MDSSTFIGRSEELQALQALLRMKTASLVVIKGRRRIGKSRLVDEFAKGHTFYKFIGLPPTKKTTAQNQRDEFAIQLGAQTGLPEIKADDWSKLFALLSEKTKSGRVIILFDEITWMGSKDPNFLGKLKNAWELYFSKNPKVIFILCGSISTWIERNIISSTGYFGRLSLELSLEELPINECSKLMSKLDFKRSPMEKMMLLAVMGGVPWYLELVDPGLSASQNIKRLCFTKDALLVKEFKKIFDDLFRGRRARICKQIAKTLAKGPKEFSKIATHLNYSRSGALSDYLEDLEISGFIHRDYSWNFKTGEESDLVKYRLSDNYVRFYLKYIGPKIKKINKQQYQDIELDALPGWETIMGLQFENLVLSNRRALLKKLGIPPNEIINDNPYYQNRTTRQVGCQIDYLIQTKYNTLYICEIKFSQNEISSSVISSVKKKAAALTLPKGYSCLPVLIHVNGVSNQVRDAEYFTNIVNFTEILID